MVSHFAPPPQLDIQKQSSSELEGDLLAARQRYLDAIEAYRKASPDSATVINKIGVAYHHMFDITDARKYYQRAIELNPHYAEAWNNLGATYHAEKKYKEAQRCYRKAIKLNPNSPLFYSNLGTAYFFQGNSKKGAEAYRQAFALDPEVFERSSAARIEESSSTKDLAMVNYVLAKTYAKAGMNERALSYLRKALGEGFNDRKKLMTDSELASLRETPEFIQLIARERNP
ncbi:TPR repeat [Acidisarcina polymorpha]|uniref:TPR repeat n=2 Tax=Acidisarcina polymorpha TaxID=2211140 RepID=A0A2Z5FU43_9BACT|nr:TPR repeat [Acidisarcina polymorpha]